MPIRRTLSISPFFVLALAAPVAAGGPPSPDPIFHDGFESGDTLAWAFEAPALDGITAAHNEVRNALGIPSLMWSAALAATAQAWVEQCVDVEPQIGMVDHNPDRSEGYPWQVGESIAGSGGTMNGGIAFSIWMLEEPFYDYPTNTCTQGTCGHYTQIVWANTQYVGCGIFDCEALQFGNTVVCNYGPAGNDGGRPY
jgi:hypothetical protein